MRYEIRTKDVDGGCEYNVLMIDGNKVVGRWNDMILAFSGHAAADLDKHLSPNYPSETDPEFYGQPFASEEGPVVIR